MPDLQISKLDAVRRQLETAVLLYFSYGDSVSIHTLAAAAYGVLDAVAMKQGGPKGFKGMFLEYAGPAGRKEVLARFNEAQNFFKHADHDSDRVLEFRTESSEILLLDACERYFLITNERVPSLEVFRKWCFIGGAAKTLELSPENEEVRQRGRRLFPGADRRAFFEQTLPIAAQVSVGTAK